MNNEYKTLDQLLAALKFPIDKLSAHTGISIPRLRGIYKYCNPNQAEVEGLIAALPRAVAELVATGGQSGNFNQMGAGHTQNITINVLVQVAPAAPQPRTRPRKPKALGESPQQWNTNRLLPAGQADPFCSLTSSTHGF